MTILKFDLDQGIYSFELTDIDTKSHSHPVVEIVQAIQGSFSLEINGQKKENLGFAIIDSNIQHRLSSQGACLKVLMMECHNPVFCNFLQSNNLTLKNGIFLKTHTFSKNSLFSKIEVLASTEDLKTPTDERVKASIDFIQNNEIEYIHLIQSLKSKVFLSESRLSHLFKEHIGVSIKKYLVWNKLKQAIRQYLVDETNLTAVSLENGFFDQAHLSHSFKSVLGISPSKVYNSRTVQS